MSAPASKGGGPAAPARPRFLYSHSILPGLPREHWAQLRSNARSKLVRSGNALFLRGDAPDGCHWLRQGFVKVSVASRAGEERIIAVLGPGATFGEPALFEDLPRVVDAHALTDCQTRLIGRGAFASWVRGNPEADRVLARALMGEVRQMAEEAVVMSFLSVRGRVARALLQLAANVGRRLPDGRSEILYAAQHAELASMAGATRESVSRFIGQWRNERLLALSPEGTFIVDEAGFEAALAEETNPPPPERTT